jgi:ribosome-binding factor A
LCASAEDISVKSKSEDRFLSGGVRRAQRKTAQLCRQAYRTLSSSIFASHSALLDVSVMSVEPAPDASRLLVTLQIGAAAEASIEEIEQAIDQVAPRLRAELAADITRKRAPELTFCLMKQEGP